jgi:FtsK/SpoIIIE family/PD-(D/E)XK nuclease superfamily/FtsK alpha domain
MARGRITVSQLKCAVVDPQWRQSWIEGKQPGTFLVAPAGQPKVFGTRFHQETERLAKWLVTPANLVKAAAIDSPSDLLRVAWSESLQDFTDQLISQGKIDEAAAFTERMRSFCGRLVELRSRTKKFENWQDVFIATEESIRNIRVPVGDTTVEIGAKVDAIRFHPKHHLEVVDYKLSQGSQQKSDLIQLAIYGHLLPLWREGCHFCGTLEYYLPEFMEVNVSIEELADIYQSLVEPVLREMFMPGPTAGVAKPPDRKPNAVAEQIVDAFKAFGLTVEAGDIVEAPQVTRVKVRPAAGVKVASLANRAEDLQVSLALDAPPLIRPGRGFVIIDLPRANRQTILLLDALERGLMKASKSPMAFPVGVGIEGEAILSDFCDSNTCHILVAGTSGSGKSEWLKTLVASLVLRNPPGHLRLALVDPKVLTFSNIAGSAYLWRPVATDLGSALAILQDAISEMDKRYQMLAQEGLVSLHDRFQEGRTDVPFLVLIFDEFADLILTGRSEKKEFEDMVARLAGKGRAAGVHLVLATQRPDRTVVTGLIKSNLPMKVCLRVANSTNSQIVIGEPGAESLLGKGDLLCDVGRGLARAQSYFIPQTDFVKALHGGEKQ